MSQAHVLSLTIAGGPTKETHQVPILSLAVAGRFANTYQYTYRKSVTQTGPRQRANGTNLFPLTCAPQTSAGWLTGTSLSAQPNHQGLDISAPYSVEDSHKARTRQHHETIGCPSTNIESVGAFGSQQAGTLLSKLEPVTEGEESEVLSASRGSHPMTNGAWALKISYPSVNSEIITHEHFQNFILVAAPLLQRLVSRFSSFRLPRSILDSRRPIAVVEWINVNGKYFRGIA